MVTVGKEEGVGEPIGPQDCALLEKQEDSGASSYFPHELLVLFAASESNECEIGRVPDDDIDEPEEWKDHRSEG